MATFCCGRRRKGGRSTATKWYKEEEEVAKDPPQEKLYKKRITFLNRQELQKLQNIVVQPEFSLLDYKSVNERGQWVWKRDWSYELDGRTYQRQSSSPRRYELDCVPTWGTTAEPLGALPGHN